MPRPDTIAVQDLVVDCVVGIYPFERDKTQPLRIDVQMELDLRKVGIHQQLRDSIDYAAVAAQLSFLLVAGRYRLIETAAHALCGWLTLPPARDENRAPIELCHLKITKPKALGGHGIPAIEVHRAASEYPRRNEPTSFGSVDLVFERRSYRIYRLNLDPGASVLLNANSQMWVSELVVGRGLLSDGKAVGNNTTFERTSGSHRYENPTDRVQSVLYADTPRDQREDELEEKGDDLQALPTHPWD